MFDRFKVPGGTRRPPWVQGQPLPIRYAATWVAARGPELLRAADADARPAHLATRPPGRRPPVGFQ